ncbi:hypothetical protein D3C75_760700 [compost metagenome]
MISPVSERSRTVLRIRLYYEAAEIRDRLVDIGRFVLPPAAYSRIERIGCAHFPFMHRAGEIDAQEQPDAVHSELIGDSGDLGQIF